MRRAVISNHSTEQALEDLEIRITLNGADMVVSRIRVAGCFTQTLRNIKESKRMKVIPLSTVLCFFFFFFFFGERG